MTPRRKPDRDKAVKANMSFPPRLLAEIDHAAEETSRTRSGFIEHLFREWQKNNE